MREKALGQFLGPVMLLAGQVEIKRFGETGQGHDEEIETVNKTHANVGEFNVHEFTSGKYDIGLQTYFEQGVSDGISIVSLEVVGDDGVAATLFKHVVQKGMDTFLHERFSRPPYRFDK